MTTKSRGNQLQAATTISLDKAGAAPKRESVTEISPTVPAVLFADVSGWRI